MSTENLQQMQADLAKLEGKEDPNADDLVRIEELKNKIAALELLQNEVSQVGVRYRSLTQEELRKMRGLAQSPVFRGRIPSEQLDQLALVLTSGFGFGSFNVELLQTVANSVGLNLKLDMVSHFETSTDQASGHAKYIAVGGGAYKMNRLYAIALTESMTRSTSREDSPVRKRVSGNGHVTPQAPAPRPLSSAVRAPKNTRPSSPARSSAPRAAQPGTEEDEGKGITKVLSWLGIGGKKRD